MICERAMELMSAGLDGELSELEQQELNAHLDRCDDCRRLYEAMASIDEKVSALEEPAPAGLKQGVMYRIGQESGKIKPGRRRFFGVGTGIGIAAAVLVLLVGTGVIRMPEQTKSAARNSDGSMNFVSTAAVDFSPNGELAAMPEPAQADPEISGDRKGIGSLVGETTASEADWMRAPAESVEEPPEESAAYAAYGAAAVPTALDDAQREICMELAAEKNAPVVFYSEFSRDSLLELLNAYAPELADRLTDAVPSVQDGLLCCRTDWETALALQEWLLAVCPGSDTIRESRLTERMEALDPGCGTLCRVISFLERPPAELAPDAFPAVWSEGWSGRLLNAENWAIVFPEEDFVPHAADPAWLVFPADG